MLSTLTTRLLYYTKLPPKISKMVIVSSLSRIATDTNVSNWGCCVTVVENVLCLGDETVRGEFVVGDSKYTFA